MAVGWVDNVSVSIKDICESGPVIPVIEIDDRAHAMPLAEALMEGGINVVEITLRTPHALNVISAISHIQDLHVGAGTLLGKEDVIKAKDAGASFGVSPGSTPDLLEACQAQGLPFLPGAASPSEVANLLSHGFHIQKFFPAEAAGGINMLKAIAGPMQQVEFCPTGGVSPNNVADYLALQNVACVGGSWIAPRNLIANKEWEKIKENARSASILKQAHR